MIVLAATAALAQGAPDDDYRSFLDQGRFFVKRGWYPDAAEQLEAAVAHPDGRLDAEAWFLLAQVRYELADLAGAQHAADRALVNSSDPVQTAACRDLLAFFDAKFGVVDLLAAREGVATELEVELLSTLFDPDLKAYLQRLLDRLDAEPLVLPYPLGLPAGRYRINGTEVDVAPGARPSIRPELVGTRAFALQTLQLEVGVGTALALGPESDHYLPGLATQVSLSIPAGPLVLGVLGDWALVPWYPANGGLAADATAVGGGARLGLELPNTQPMVFRPSVGYRLARMPGVERPCAVDGTTATCAADAPAHLWAYPAALAHTPFVELAAFYQDRRKRSSWGAGVKVIGEWGLGRLPAEGAATTADAGTFAYVVTDRAWASPGLRVLAGFAFAF